MTWMTWWCSGSPHTRKLCEAFLGKYTRMPEFSLLKGCYCVHCTALHMLENLEHARCNIMFVVCRLHLHKYVQTHTYTYIHTHKHTHIDTHTYTYMCIYISIHIIHAHIYISIYTHTYMYWEDVSCNANGLKTELCDCYSCVICRIKRL